MAEQKDGESRGEKTLKVCGGGEPINAGEEVEEANNGRPRVDPVGPNLIVQKQSLKANSLVFLSLLLFFSIASPKVSSDNCYCDDGWESQRLKYERKQDEDMVEEDLVWQEFGRDTNRLDYFRFVPFDVHEDNHVNGNGSYDYGDGRREYGMVVRPNLGQERDGTLGDMTRHVYDGIIANDDSDSGGSVVQRWEPERDGGGGEDGGYLLVARWWEKWWVWLALWKIV
ncbi:unnamed protein product [Lactuca virosa]|uniref:Uncharacterized protein n=1 Tax=Lactuca virosa TaxID=75947 RepID=A0AAU9MAC9_9ASTR|nr:unnamed protein product [Lactuca virosa]